MIIFALTVGAWLTASLLCLVIVALIHTHDRLTALERKLVGCEVPARDGCLLCELDELDVSTVSHSIIAQEGEGK